MAERTASTHIRTASGRRPAVFSPLSPLAVPLLLKARHLGWNAVAHRPFDPAGVAVLAAYTVVFASLAA